MLKRIFVVAVFYLTIICLWTVTAVPIFENHADKFEVTYKASSTANFINLTKKEFKFKSGIKSESADIKLNAFNLKEFLDVYDAETVFIEKTEAGVSYYAYSNKIKYKKIIDGKKINLHINISNDGVTVGSPIIFGGF
ncbi:MAG: YwmB family TATA-box binding protein [Clostridia bacterium]|nr:YwmB family TATA-box binding protein [Clostridia bacterium]